jgi:Glu-tRNA(Gln) amidotransferase subunit E-like FAD-binding protein
MEYIYLSGFSRYPIADVDNLLQAYEHLGEEMYAHALTFIGRIHGILHRLELQPYKIVENDIEKTVYAPQLTRLNLGEAVKIATPNQGSLLLAG